MTTMRSVLLVLEIGWWAKSIHAFSLHPNRSWWAGLKAHLHWAPHSTWELRHCLALDPADLPWGFAGGWSITCEVWTRQLGYGCPPRLWRWAPPWFKPSWGSQRLSFGMANASSWVMVLVAAHVGSSPSSYLVELAQA